MSLPTFKHTRFCPTCGQHQTSSTEPFPPFKPVPLTVEVCRDLWLYFGEELHTIANGAWPSLPPGSVCYPIERPPELLDTPFTRAFLAWRTRGVRS